MPKDRVAGKWRVHYIRTSKEMLVINPPPFAMKQVKAVRVNKPETGGKRRRH
jgi:hypothetical protein